MTEYVVLGATYAFAAAVQPGPLQAFLVSRTLSDGWRSTAPAVFAPLLSDAPIIVAVLLVLSHVPSFVVLALRLAGGVFLLWLAVGAYRSFAHYVPPGGNQPAAPGRNLMQATVVNLLNPSPYLAWSTVLGPLLIEAWRRTPLDGGVLLVTFYAVMIVSTAAVVALFARAHSLGPRVARGMVGASALALAGFGIYQLVVVGHGLIAQGRI